MDEQPRRLAAGVPRRRAQAPVGYVLGPGLRRLAIDPMTAPYVREAFLEAARRPLPVEGSS